MTTDNNNSMPDNRWRDTIIIVLCAIPILAIILLTPSEYFTSDNIRYVLIVYVIPVLLYIKAHLEIKKLQNRVDKLENPTKKPPDEKN